jgi:hypothetical protein
VASKPSATSALTFPSPQVKESRAAQTTGLRDPHALAGSATRDYPNPRTETRPKVGLRADKPVKGGALVTHSKRAFNMARLVKSVGVRPHGVHDLPRVSWASWLGLLAVVSTNGCGTHANKLTTDTLSPDSVPDAATDGAVASTLDIRPRAAYVVPGGHMVFTAYSSNVVTTDVSWSVVESDGGQIDDVGSYTAPLTIPGASVTYHIQVKSKSDNALAKAAVEVSLPTYDSVSKACASEPMPSTGTTYYYCDCGTGSQDSCVHGDDSNPGTDPLLPRRTIADAAKRFASMAAYDTVALCQGGAFNSAGLLDLGSSHCASDLKTTCNELRDYQSPVFDGKGKKPQINASPGYVGSLFTSDGPGKGGIRFLNLRLLGDGKTTGGQGFFMYNAAHDLTMCNLEIEAFDVAINNNNNGPQGITSRIVVTGSKFTNNLTQGYLGGSSDSEISYSQFEGNGCDNTRDHAMYLSSDKEIRNLAAIGNHIHGQIGSVCHGGVFVGHLAVDGFLVEDNVVEIDAAANDPSGQCWGIGFGCATNPHSCYLRNAKIARNTIKNGGNMSLTVGNCPNCIIENNLIIQNWSSAVGIAVADAAARSGVDDVNTGNIIRNNTIWFGPKSLAGSTGIRVGIEGTGHVIANNIVYLGASSDGSTSNCFDYTLPVASYKFINNNDCYAQQGQNWEHSRGSLTKWVGYAAAQGLDFDSLSKTDDPGFTTNGTDFSLGSDSPVLGQGDAAHGASVDITGATRPKTPSIGAYE